MSHNYRTPTTLTKHTTACRSSQRSILSHTDTKQTHKVCASMEIEPSRAFTPSSSSRFVTNVHFMPLKMTLSKNARIQPRIHHRIDRSILSHTQTSGRYLIDSATMKFLLRILKAVTVFYLFMSDSAYALIRVSI